jgi:hypothetical protein
LGAWIDEKREQERDEMARLVARLDAKFALADLAAARRADAHLESTAGNLQHGNLRDDGRQRVRERRVPEQPPNVALHVIAPRAALGRFPAELDG